MSEQSLIAVAKAIDRLRESEKSLSKEIEKETQLLNARERIEKATVQTSETLKRVQSAIASDTALLSNKINVLRDAYSEAMTIQNAYVTSGGNEAKVLEQNDRLIGGLSKAIKETVKDYENLVKEQALSVSQNKEILKDAEEQNKSHTLSIRNLRLLTNTLDGVSPPASLT